MIQPINNNVVIKLLPSDESEVKIKGIYLKKIENNSQNIAEVIAFDLQITKNNDQFPIKLKDKVIFEEYKASKFKYKNNDYLLVNIKNILAIIN